MCANNVWLVYCLLVLLGNVRSALVELGVSSEVSYSSTKAPVEIFIRSECLDTYDPFCFSLHDLGLEPSSSAATGLHIHIDEALQRMEAYEAYGTRKLYELLPVIDRGHPCNFFDYHLNQTYFRDSTECLSLQQEIAFYTMELGRVQHRHRIANSFKDKVSVVKELLEYSEAVLKEAMISRHVSEHLSLVEPLFVRQEVVPTLPTDDEFYIIQYYSEYSHILNITHCSQAGSKVLADIEVEIRWRSFSGLNFNHFGWYMCETRTVTNFLFFSDLGTKTKIEHFFNDYTYDLVSPLSLQHTLPLIVESFFNLSFFVDFSSTNGHATTQWGVSFSSVLMTALYAKIGGIEWCAHAFPIDEHSPGLAEIYPWPLPYPIWSREFHWQQYFTPITVNTPTEDIAHGTYFHSTDDRLLSLCTEHSYSHANSSVSRDLRFVVRLNASCECKRYTFHLENLSQISSDGLFSADRSLIPANMQVCTLFTKMFLLHHSKHNLVCNHGHPLNELMHDSFAFRVANSSNSSDSFFRIPLREQELVFQGFRSCNITFSSDENTCTVMCPSQTEFSCYIQDYNGMFSVQDCSGFVFANQIGLLVLHTNSSRILHTWENSSITLTPHTDLSIVQQEIAENDEALMMDRAALHILRNIRSTSHKECNPQLSQRDLVRQSIRYLASQLGEPPRIDTYTYYQVNADETSQILANITVPLREFASSHGMSVQSFCYYLKLEVNTSHMYMYLVLVVACVFFMLLWLHQLLFGVK